MRYVAVLFTDVVGSTRYFKAHGDVAGRALLRRHQEIASSIIARHSGTLVKVVGDSVMAWFAGAREALKAAIRMQEEFGRFREAGGEGLRVRVGIHAGKVLAEENDIYGDVVNTGAKLTGLAAESQILVSETVVQGAAGLPSVRFEPIHPWQRGPLPEEIAVYRVVCETPFRGEEQGRVVLSVHPLWALGGEDLEEVWRTFREQEATIIGGPFRRGELTGGEGCDYVFQEETGALEGARRLARFFREKCGLRGSPRVPVQMSLTRETSFRAVVDPHFLLVSEEILERFPEGKVIGTEPDPVDAGGLRLFKVALYEGQEQEDHDFTIWKGLWRSGPLPPCYYCGRGGHEPARCPSKDLPDLTRSFARLGYLSLGEIDALFVRYFTDEGPEQDRELVHHALHEVKRVYQLRFLRSIWDAEGDDWARMRASRAESRGGLAWLALDSLRVGDLETAASILEEAAAQHPTDYRIDCLHGYAAIERGSLSEALDHFERALGHASKSCHQTFTLLQLSRLAYLTGNASGALAYIRRLLALNPLCPEAVYEEVFLRLLTGKEQGAFQRIGHLVEDDREWYVQALIDPDLAPFRDTMADHLDRILEGARERADEAYRQAKQEMDEAIKFLGSREKMEVETLFSRVKAGVDSRSYFGYLDAVRYGTMVVSICHGGVRERTREVSVRLQKLKGGVDLAGRQLAACRYPKLVKDLTQEVSALGARVAALHVPVRPLSPEEMGEWSEGWEEISRALKKVESRIEKAKAREILVAGCLRFAGRAALLLGLVLFAGLILIPVISHHTGILSGGSEESLGLGGWTYQKPFLLGGGLTSFLLALLLTIRRSARE